MSFRFNPFTGALDVVKSPFSIPETKYLYVDKSRADSYTPNGTVVRPFLTIQSAINQIVSNGDNGSVGYYISVAPGFYSEALSLNNLNLVNVTIDGNTAPATFLGLGGSAIDSSSNNTNLRTLIVRNITFEGNINLVGDTNGTGFLSGSGSFVDCAIHGTIVATNAGTCVMYDSNFDGASATFQNLNSCGFLGGDGVAPGVSVSVITNGGANAPTGFFNTALFVEKTVFGADTTIDSGSIAIIREGARVGYPGGTITCNGTLQAYSSFFRSTVTGSGTLSDRGSFYAVLPTIASITDDGMVVRLRANGAADASNGVLMWKNGHLVSTQTTAPTATPTANAGTGATCTLSNATDTAGSISLTTGTGAFGAGAVLTVTFNKTFGVAPIVLIFPTNEQAATDGGSFHHIYVSSTTTGFSVNFGVQPNSSGTLYMWNYLAVQTQ